jgi:glyoxylase-like metal-dependent hydrolase (beta-lactamase superfamily II)
MVWDSALKKIIPDLYTFTGLLLGRVYLIRDPDGLTIVDAGLFFAARTIARQLRAAGHRPTDVKRILITHAHPDHIGGLPRLQRLTDAEVISSALDGPVVEGREPMPRMEAAKMTLLNRLMNPRPMKLRGTPVDREIGEGETLPVMGGLQVLATPGHTPGHLSFWQPQKRVLICGDVIVNTLWLRLPAAAYTVDMDENKRSVKLLAGLEPRVACFGHGEPLMRDAAAKIRGFADRLEIK